MKTKKIFLLSVFLMAILVFCFVGNITKMIFYPVKFLDYISEASIQTGIDKNIILSVIKVESNFKKSATSNSGAIGLMQIMPNTSEYMVEYYNLKNITDLYSEKENVLIGSYYLKYLSQKFENWDTIFAAYNAGETTVRNWLNIDKYSNDGIRISTTPYKETTNYIYKINMALKVYNSY